MPPLFNEQTLMVTVRSSTFFTPPSNGSGHTVSVPVSSQSIFATTPCSERFHPAAGGTAAGRLPLDTPRPRRTVLVGGALVTLIYGPSPAGHQSAAW